MKLWHYAKLIVHTLSQMMTYLTSVVADFVKQNLLVCGDKQTQVHFCNGEILAYLNLGHGDQGSFK